MQKQIQTFFNESDEVTLSKLITSEFKGVVFLDGNLWSSGEIESKSNIQECSSKTIYIWNKKLVPELPTIKRNDGWLKGPAAGIVVQLMRGPADGENLVLSGRLAVGYETNALYMREFYNSLESIIKSISTNKLKLVEYPSGKTLNDRVVDFWVGKNTMEWLLRGDKRNFCKSRNSKHYYQKQDT
jgi:hypothetical protein